MVPLPMILCKCVSNHYGSDHFNFSPFLIIVHGVLEGTNMQGLSLCNERTPTDRVILITGE